MSKTIPVESLPHAVIGYEVFMGSDEVKELRSKGALIVVVQDRITRGIAEHVLIKHHDDIEETAHSASIDKGGRRYRLEIATFTREQWIAHVAEWNALEAERDALKAELSRVRWEIRQYCDSGQIIDALNEVDPDWNSNPDRSPTQNAVAWIRGMVAEQEEARDKESGSSMRNQP